MVKVYLLDKRPSSLKSYISVGGDLNEFSRYQTIFIAYVSKASHPPCNCPGLQLNTGFFPDGSTFVWRWKTIKDLITNIVNKYSIKSKWYPIWFYFFPQIFLCSTLNPSWSPCIDSRNIVRTIQILCFIKMLAIVVTQILDKKI